MENLSSHTTRLLKWGLRTLLTVAIVSGLALFALLVWSADNASRFARQTDWLLLLNGVLAVALMVWVLVMALRLVRQIRRRQFGARLTGRFARAFVLVGLLPGLIVYLLSVQFMSRSIESWFNVRVDNALEAGLSLGRAALDNQLAQLTRRLQTAARQLSQRTDSAADSGVDIDLGAALLQLRESTQADETMIFTGSGRPLAFSSSRYGQLIPEGPPALVLNQLRVARLYAQAEEVPSGSGRGTGSLNLRVVVPIPSPTPAAPTAAAPGATSPTRPSTLAEGRGASLSVGGSETRWLQAIQPVSAEVARNASLVQQGFSDYQELALSRLGLRKLYGITLTLALVLSIFAAIMAALTLSRRLVRPLLRLAAGTQAVAVGDYRPLPQPPSKDELGQLTRSFNAMIQQLDEARRMVEANRLQLERSNVYLESVLGNLSSGVLVLDAQWRILLTNQGAQNILQIDLQAAKGRPLHAAVKRMPAARAFERHIRQAFETHEGFGAMQAGRPYWQQQFELHTPQDSHTGSHPGNHPSTTHVTTHVTTLLARGSRLELGAEHATDASPAQDNPDGRSSGYLVVFDDISEVISANRAVAWAEVGRRLAHEIKNPLTPIQLSAERLTHKLTHRLSPDDADMLQRSTRTIVNQVTALKQMVDEFREYARTPPLQWQPVCLNALVTEVLTLYGWEAEANNDRLAAAPASVRFHTDLQDGLPDLAGDASQLRQVLHNLFANARDAVQAVGSRVPGLIEVQTRQVQTGKDTDHSGKMAVRLTVCDNGAGFDAQVLARVFEPYITTKATGTGLGLAIVRKIVEGHGGRVDVSNLPTGGARISILFTRFAQTLAGVDAPAGDAMDDNIDAVGTAKAAAHADAGPAAHSVQT